MVAHPSAPTKTSNELDFFTGWMKGQTRSYENEADDEGHGAGMMDRHSLPAPPFYHYVARNLDRLTKRFPESRRRKVIADRITKRS